MKRKIRLSMLMIFSLMFLGGWGKKNVELLNDKKLIDLDIAIGICMPGADGMEQSAHKDDSGAEDKASWQAQKGGAEDGKRTVVIRITGQKVTYDSVQWTEIDGLKDRIRQDSSDKVSFQVIDDFAEAHVYRRILMILEELKSEIGLTYTKE